MKNLKIRLTEELREALDRDSLDTEEENERRRTIMQLDQELERTLLDNFKPTTPLK
jgi:hypothetical protein